MIFPPLYRFSAGSGGATPPEPPTLTLVGVGDGEITLHYTPPTDDYADGEINYDSGGDISTLDVTVAGDYTITALDNGTTYVFTARAEDIDGNWSVRSNGVSATPTAPADTTTGFVPDIAGDFSVFDGRTTVTYRRRVTSSVNEAGRRSEMFHSITVNALRERAPISESFIGGGGQVVTNTAWSIPKVQLTYGGTEFIPTAEDQIVDENGIVYVVTDLEQLTLATRYRILTRRR